MLQYERPQQHFDYAPAIMHPHYYTSPASQHHHQQQQQQQQQQQRPDTAGSTASSAWDHVSPVDSPTSPTFAYQPNSNLVLPSPAEAGHDLNDDGTKTYSFVSLPGNTVKKRPRRRYDEIERLYSCNWPECTKAYGTLNHLNAHINMQRHGQKRTPAEFKDMRKQWRKAKKEEAERTARLSSATNGSAPGFSLNAAAEHSHQHHHLAQHASLPDLHQQQSQHMHHGHSQSLNVPSYAPSQPLYRPLQLQTDEYGHPIRRHSVGTIATYGSQPQQQQRPVFHHTDSHPHFLPPTHALQHTLSNASLSSASHMSLSPPQEYVEPPPQQQQAASYGATWMSRAEAQGWDTQPQYAYEPHHGQATVYEQPRVLYDARGTLPPDSTLLTPLDVPGYAHAGHNNC
jgi:hypothetical protein